MKASFKLQASRKQYKILSWMLDSYKRHKDYDPALLGKVMKQAQDNGVEYIISTISDEARKLYKCARAVGCESHLATGYIRFQDNGDTLVARADFEHDVVDIVLSHFMRRFPTKKVVIISNNIAYVGFERKIKKQDPANYPIKIEVPKAGADPEWITYYDSQYIEARRNRKLAMQHIPKKLWKKFGLNEANKIDQGIPSTTLTDFIPSPSNSA